MLKSDLYEEIRPQQQFSLILSNPPFVPVPPMLQTALYTSGGPSGENVLSEIIVKASEYLRPEKSCVCIITQVTNAQNTSHNKLAQWWKGGEAKVSVRYTKPIPSSNFAGIYSRGSSEVAKIWEDHFRQVGIWDVSQGFIFIWQSMNMSSSNFEQIEDNGLFTESSSFKHYQNPIKSRCEW